MYKGLIFLKIFFHILILFILKKELVLNRLIFLKKKQINKTVFIFHYVSILFLLIRYPFSRNILMAATRVDAERFYAAYSEGKIVLLRRQLELSFSL